MAGEAPTGPAIDSSFAYRQQLAQNNGGGGGGGGGSWGGKPGWIMTPFGPIVMDWNASGGMSLAAAAPFGKTLPSLLNGRGKPGGVGDKFLQAWASLGDGFIKSLSNTGIQYAPIDGSGGGSVSPNIPMDPSTTQGYTRTA